MNWQNMYTEIAEHYPNITVELWVEQGIQGESFWSMVRHKLGSGIPQRLAVGWPEMMTAFEFMLVPLDNYWDSLRMTGTDSKFTCVSIVGHGCYAFNLHSFTEAGYIREKLGLGMPEAIGTMLLFEKLSGEWVF